MIKPFVNPQVGVLEMAKPRKSRRREVDENGRCELDQRAIDRKQMENVGHATKSLPKFKEIDIDIVQNFVNTIFEQDNTYNTIHGDIGRLSTFSRFFESEYEPVGEGVPLADISNEDMQAFFDHKRYGTKPNGKSFSTASIRNDYILLRTFFRWYYTEYKLGDWEPLFHKIPMPKRKKNTLPVDDVIQENDVSDLMQACLSQRDRALVILLWDSAARVNELLNANIRHLEFNGDIATLLVKHAKNGDRVIPLYESVPELLQLLNTHPYKDDPDAPIFLTSIKYDGKYRRLNMRTVENSLKTIKKRAKCKKRITPHQFRHGRLTFLAKKGFNEPMLRMVAGWAKDSGMAKVYLHISNNDLMDKYRQMHGLQKEDEGTKVSKLKPQNCIFCKQSNPSDATYCSSCGKALSVLTNFKLAEIKETVDTLTPGITEVARILMQNPEASAKLVEALTTVSNGNE